MMDVSLANPSRRSQRRVKSSLWETLTSCRRWVGVFSRDLIQSQCGKVVRLQQVSGTESLIVTNAHRVNTGLPLVAGPMPMRRISSLFQEKTLLILQTLHTLMTQRLEKAFGVVFIGCSNSHADGLWRTWNEESESSVAGMVERREELERGDRKFRVGDKVMQVRNNYDKEVFNGDVGVIQGLDAAARELIVAFDGRALEYKSEELDELNLAYAVTVHKSQGSEYPVVLLPFHGQHYMLLRRNLLYTALTRGKRLVVVVGSERAIKMATERDDMNRRYSKLEERLKRLV